MAGGVVSAHGASQSGKEKRKSVELSGQPHSRFGAVEAVITRVGLVCWWRPGAIMKAFFAWTEGLLWIGRDMRKKDLAMVVEEPT